MRTEPATLIVVEIGSIAFFFLVLPFFFVVAKLPKVWHASRAVGLVLGVVVVLTVFFFALFIAGLIALTFFGA